LEMAPCGPFPFSRVLGNRTAAAGKPPDATGGDGSVVKQNQNTRTNLTNC
jgi:hypothetical protein